MAAKTLSPAGAHLIKNYEALRLRRYICPAKKPTIGYGHVLRPGDPDIITLEQAEKFFQSDTAWAIAALNRSPGVEKLNQNQFDALVSLIFNIGPEAWRSSTIRRHLAAGILDGIPAQIQRWNKATIDGELVVLQGLVNRRASEAALFQRSVK